MKRIITLILVLTVFSLTISAQKKIPYLLKKIAAHYDSAAVKIIDRLTSSSCHPEILIEQKCDFLMTLH